MSSHGLHTILNAKAAGGAIRLVHPKWTDFEDWVTLRRDNADYLKPWEPSFSTASLNRSSYRARLGRLKKLVQQDRAYPFYIFKASSDTLIGACNITHIDRGVAQSAKLGYWIGEAYAGNGFARASVRTVSQFCFDNLGLHRIEAAVQPENEASIKVLHAVGYAKEGTARGLLKINNQWADHHIYALLSGD